MEDSATKPDAASLPLAKPGVLCVRIEPREAPWAAGQQNARDGVAENGEEKSDLFSECRVSFRQSRRNSQRQVDVWSNRFECGRHDAPAKRVQSLALARCEERR